MYVCNIPNSHSLFLYHRLIIFMYYQAFVLFSTYLSIRGCRCSCNKVNITESEMLYSLVQVIATIKWTKL